MGLGSASCDDQSSSRQRCPAGQTFAVASMGDTVGLRSACASNLNLRRRMIGRSLPSVMPGPTLPAQAGAEAQMSAAAPGLHVFSSLARCASCPALARLTCRVPCGTAPAMPCPAAHQVELGGHSSPGQSGQAHQGSSAHGSQAGAQGRTLSLRAGGPQKTRRHTAPSRLDQPPSPTGPCPFAH